MSTDRVAAYVQGGESLGEAIKGLTKGEFLAYPVAGTWSIQQIVLHLLDSDLVASDRMKRIIAEENPTIIGYDESAFAKNLYYEKQDPFLAAELFRLNRQVTGVILRQLPETAYSRVGMHSERGKLALGEMVEMYIQHLEHHLRFLREKRKILGK